MFAAKSIPADHKDLIHDVSYDFYGKRFATCSSDQTVKVWDQDEEGQWVTSASWKAHSGSVWKVTWAHPEFGQILATCSFDRSVVIWEEKNESSSEKGPQYTWVRKAALVDSRTSVMDVKFAPRHLGLLLATGSADGTLRIYEAPDIMNLSQWNPQHELNCRMSCSCISWNPSSFDAPMIAVGSDDSSSTDPKVQIYELSENSRRWFRVDVIAFIQDPVYDISFAPNVARDQHLLAVGSRDLRIVGIKCLSSNNSLERDQQDLLLSTPSLSDAGFSKYEMRQMALFDDHKSKVWRVSWNITGTILASCGEDGSIRLWKSNYLDSWKSVGVIKGDSAAMGSGASPSASGHSFLLRTPRN